MKQKLFFFTLVISITASAQKINITKGQKINILTTSTQDVDMTGLGMQMKSNTNSTGIFEVIETDKENLTAAFTLSKLSLKMDMMGQETNFDSEKKEDAESEMGKALTEKIGKPVSFKINKNSGLSTSLAAPADTASKEDVANPLEGIMDSFGGAKENTTVESVFFIIPTGKKIGDTWIDSSKNKGMKEVKTYTYKSLEKGVANIGLFSTLEGSNSVEMQGMNMDIAMSSKTEGEIIVDSKTCLVKKRSSVMDLTGNIDVMGQSVPIISKSIVTVDYK